VDVRIIDFAHTGKVSEEHDFASALLDDGPSSTASSPDPGLLFGCTSLIRLLRRLLGEPDAPLEKDYTRLAEARAAGSADAVPGLNLAALPKGIAVPIAAADVSKVQATLERYFEEAAKAQAASLASASGERADSKLSLGGSSAESKRDASGSAALTSGSGSAGAAAAGAGASSGSAHASATVGLKDREASVAAGSGVAVGAGKAAVVADKGCT
jgi:hypothetical protein